MEHGVWSMRNRGRTVRLLVVEAIIAMLETGDHDRFKVIYLFAQTLHIQDYQRVPYMFRDVSIPLTRSPFIFFIKKWIYMQ